MGNNLQGTTRISRKEYLRKWRIRNKEKSHEYQAKYYRKNREKVLMRGKTYREENKETIKAKKAVYNRERYKKTRTSELLRVKAYQQGNRINCLRYYSIGETPQCCYPDCLITDIDVLCIDHVNGGGSLHRKSIKGSSIYTWLIKNNFPNGY